MIPMTSAFLLFAVVFLLILLKRRKPAIYLALLGLILCIGMFVLDITVTTAIEL